MVWAIENGWAVTQNPDSAISLDGSFTTRYKEIPSEYLDFLRAVKACATSSEQAWFLCEEEYNNSSEVAFKWNEFESLSLEAAQGDEKWRSEITAWWDGYLPIMMSVAGGYSFYAIDLADEIGAIVRGEEPEFEEVAKVAENLEQFLEYIMLGTIRL